MLHTDKGKWQVGTGSVAGGWGGRVSGGGAVIKLERKSLMKKVPEKMK